MTAFHQRARSCHDVPLPRRRDQRRRHDARRRSHVHDLDRSPRGRHRDGEPGRRDECRGECRRQPERRDDDLPLRLRCDGRLRQSPARAGRRGRRCRYPARRRPADAERARSRHDLPLPGRRDESPGDDLRPRPVFTTVAPAPFALPVALPPPAPAPSLPPATRPVLGKSATIAATSGEIIVQIPGSGIYLPLSAASTVPVGTTIDATRGTLKLTNIKNSQRQAADRELLGRGLHLPPDRAEAGHHRAHADGAAELLEVAPAPGLGDGGKARRASSGARTTTAASSRAGARRSRPCAAPPGSRATPVRARSSG